MCAFHSQSAQCVFELVFFSESHVLPHETILGVEHDRRGNRVHVAERSLAGNESRISHRHWILEPKAVAKRDDQWTILWWLEHDRRCVDARRVRVQEMRQEPRLCLRRQIVGRKKHDDRGPTYQRVGIEYAFAVGELVGEM